MVKNLPAIQEMQVPSLGWEDPLEKGREELLKKEEDSWKILPGEGNSNPLQYSCLENSMDRGAWRAAVHGFAKSQTWLSNQHFHFFLMIPY